MNAGQIQKACRDLVLRGTKPTLPEVRPLVDAFYVLAGNGAGGHLHIVLDDGNWERSHVEWCYRVARDDSDHTAAALAEVLLMLSGSQRRRL